MCSSKISVCGLDEAGRGPLAGPVVAACVYIPDSARRKTFWAEVTDSKILSPEKRDYFYHLICEQARWAIAESSVEEIDRLNILHASLAAMTKAYELCKTKLPEDHCAYIDGNQTPRGLSCPSRTFVGGDLLHTEISAASILAKVTRDRVMQQLHETFPYYGWKTNMGYSTKEHLEGLNRHGITVHHRRSFAPVQKILKAA